MTAIPQRSDISDDYIFLKSNTYDPKNKDQYIKIFNNNISEGKICGSFSNDIWKCFNGVNKTTIYFSMNRNLYCKRFGNKYGITYSTISEILRYYVLFLLGRRIFKTIAYRVRIITGFLTHYGNPKIKNCQLEIGYIIEFLTFLNLRKKDIEDIRLLLIKKESYSSHPRNLAHIINYIALHDAVNEVCKRNTEEFIKWFPIYFWANITFIIPLRPTEMLVTPFDCINREEGKIFLSLRRTKLKKRVNKVHHSVVDDYTIFHYEIPETESIQAIEKYQKLTGMKPRAFLFHYSVHSHMLSLHRFNYLLRSFVDLNLTGNHKYDYLRFASGIKDFQYVNAGDSRHLAMSNLYFQDVGADICRQLADHIDISTSAGYYLNISETVEATSIMMIQNMLNREKYEYFAPNYKENPVYSFNRSVCSAPEQPLTTGDVTPCIRENHLENNCIGCRYYIPSESELYQEMSLREKELQNASKAVLNCMKKDHSMQDIDIDKIFLDAHTAITRYKVACDYKAKEIGKKWLAQQSTLKKTF